MGADGRLICTFTLRAPAHRTGATRNILLIQRNGCQAERLLTAKQARPASRSGNVGNTAARLHAHAFPAVCSSGPRVRTVTSLTPDHREASGWELRTAATTS
jgi:hypothetical protein